MKGKDYDEIKLANGNYLKVHTRDKCAGEFCCVHNPSEHPLNKAPYVWRWDRYLMERLCPHGVGHPDPDDVDYIRATQGDEAAQAHGIHGCDGCCSPKGYQWFSQAEKIEE